MSRLLSRRPSLEEASRLDSRISSRERSHSTSSRAPEKHGVSMFAVEHQKGLVCNPGLQPRAQHDWQGTTGRARLAGHDWQGTTGRARPSRRCRYRQRTPHTSPMLPPHLQHGSNELLLLTDAFITKIVCPSRGRRCRRRTPHWICHLACIARQHFSLF